MKKGDIVFIHYLDRDKEGHEIDVHGDFELEGL